MRLSLVLFLAACGGAGAAAPGADEPMRSGSSDAHAVAIVNLVSERWGASANDLLLRYGGIRARDHVNTIATVEGREAKITFTLSRGKLRRVLVDFTDRFPSMDSCAEAWRALRDRIDENGSVGRSSSDNLAATWEHPTANARLACDPDDSGAAHLSLESEQGHR